MSRRYEEPADVDAPDGRIAAFWWRGKRYRVQAVLSTWREAGGWWEAANDTAQPWARGDAREIWRVDAVLEPAETSGDPGVYAGRHTRVSTETSARRLRVVEPRGARHPAGRKRPARRMPSGTYEISRDLRRGTWTLLRVLD